MARIVRAAGPRSPWERIGFGRFGSRHPATLFGLRFNLIAVMAVLLLLTALAVGYSILALTRLRDATTRLASKDLPSLVSAQRLADDVASLGEILKATRAPRSAAEHQEGLAAVRSSIASVRRNLGEMDQATVAESASLRARLAHRLDRLTVAAGDLDQLLARRIAFTERQEAMRRQIQETYSGYMSAVDDANRQMRALVARTLAMDMPNAANEGHLQERLDAFQDREMSWLGTTQDLRSDGRELNTIAEAAMAAREPAALKALATHSSTVALRMALHKRLPDTPVVRILATRTAEFTGYFPGDSARGLFATRAEELQLEQQSAAAFEKAQVIHDALRRDALFLVQALSTGTEATAGNTNWTVARAKRYLLAFSFVAVLIAAVAIRHVVVGPVKRVERLTASMLQAASEIREGRPSSIDAEMGATLRGGGRDEIVAMGEALVFFLEAIAERDRARVEADRAVQDTLRQSEQRLRQVIDLVPHLIFAKDVEGRYILANRAMADFCGMPVNALIGAHMADVPAMAAREARLHADDEAVITSGLPKQIVEESVPDAAGRPRDLMTLKIPFTCSGTDAPAVLGVSEDITERRRAEQERAELEHQLGQAQKLESVGRLAGGVAHDFNNLLTVITGYGQMLLAGQELTERVRRQVEAMVHAGGRAAALTQQLLAFSRKQVLELRPVQLNEVVAGMEQLLPRVIREDIVLSTHLAPDLPIVKADRTQLEQVILNLAVNARDAMPDGGRLVLETRPAVLDATYCQHHPEVRPGAFAMLAVSDTGLGMDQSTMARIFEPFFTTKDQTKGTGLGLATVYGIVKQTGGHISVYSEVGRGTVFKIYLPVDPDAPGRGPELPAHPDGARLRGTETILLVEDDAQVRATTRTMLEHYGYAVVEAPSGGDALQLAPQVTEPIALLLTDVIMPGMNGRELAGRWAARHPKAKVLYMSGYTEGLIADQGVLEESVHLLPKPFDPDALARKVREVLDARN